MKLRFCLKEVQVENNQQIQIIGNKEDLGIWHIPNAIEMVPGLTDSMTQSPVGYLKRSRSKVNWIAKTLSINISLAKKAVCNHTAPNGRKAKIEC